MSTDNIPLDPHLAQTLRAHVRDLCTLVGPMDIDFSAAHPPFIYVDGGARHRSRLGTLGPSIGDGDSGPIALDFLISPKKDYSDFAYVLKHIPPSVQLMELRGFTGGRRDQEWAVAGDLSRHLEDNPGREVLWDDHSWVLAPGKWSREVKGEFSILTLEPQCPHLSGACEYHLGGRVTLQPWSSHGISNVGSGVIHIECEKPLFLLMNFDKPANGAPFTSRS